ncbi:Hyaluronan synthase 2 [Madurella mycetomatis]|uniref:Hyaluronan synthase 2 n=1 Tax=Madurella mycetomatis TaxID=100816 RepID=A0A175VZ12_9PEZI|nr:Hyaluronan synthase 2 [Madurella mycetomatis]
MAAKTNALALVLFEDNKISGVRTCQRRIYNWLGAAYIERRNFEISATYNIDGGASCMSGRTGAYRTEIIKGHDFLDNFKNERWGNYTLNADDDNFVTRWLYKAECEIETTLETDIRFLYQCTRWTRSNWRSNWTSLVHERHVYKQQPWCTYALHFATFTSLAFVFDPAILYSCWRATESWVYTNRLALLRAEIIFKFGFTKVKLTGLFRKRWTDIRFLPASILFGYFHGFIKLYALFTLSQTSWGSRADDDHNNNLRTANAERG